MLKIKKLDLYVLRNFIGAFFVTFFVCLFVLLMQFLWKYVDDLIGKGLGLDVLGQFLFYASLTLVPMALPLAILLASLMTFGNMGERLELLAMKAAGVSLFRIMRPLIITISFVCIGAFFFSNNAIPWAQKKFYTLMRSIQNKSPEVEIPENVFYDGISGYSIYVKKKDTRKGLLKDIMIYDRSDKDGNMTVTIADSARIQFTDDKRFIVLTLYSGESFEDLKTQTPGNNEKIPYRRESFLEKQTLIEFDSNFKEADESTALQGRFVSKDIDELRHNIDSIKIVIDSLSGNIKRDLTRTYAYANTDTFQADTLPLAGNYNAYKLYDTLSIENQLKAIKRAEQHIRSKQNELSLRKSEIDDKDYFRRRNSIEWHRKFTLSFACLIFFFIGAPLGAIIKKGGLGAPVVISVLLFIIYYIIDNAGYKFAREGVWDVPYGMWLSAAILLPFGIFLTYKAATDSVILDADSYIAFWKKLTGKFKKQKKDKK